MVREVKLLVEGGGTSRKSQIACRESFRIFIKKAGFEGKMPRVVACGSRNIAFDRYRKAVLTGKEAFLIVDSEGPCMPTVGETIQKIGFLGSISNSAPAMVGTSPEANRKKIAI